MRNHTTGKTPQIPDLILSRSAHHVTKPFSLQVRHHDCCGPATYDLISRLDQKTADILISAGAAVEKNTLDNKTLSLTIVRRPEAAGLPFSLHLENPETDEPLLLASIGEEIARDILSAGKPFYLT